MPFSLTVHAGNSTAVPLPYRPARPANALLLTAARLFNTGVRHACRAYRTAPKFAIARPDDAWYVPLHCLLTLLPLPTLLHPSVLRTLQI